MKNENQELVKRRKLDECYVVLYCIETPKLNFKDAEGNINSTSMYIFYGCNIKGVRKFLTLSLKDKYEKVSEWYGFFERLKSRGIKEIIYASLPEDERLINGLKLSFKNVEVYESCHYVLDKILKYFSSKKFRKYEIVFKKIYTSETIKEYEINYQEFKNEFGEYKFVIDLVDEDIKKVKEMYKYPKSIRNVLYNFYYIRGYKRLLETIINSSTYFTNEEEIVDKIIEKKEIIEKMGQSVKNWAETLNSLYELKKELIKKYL